MRYGLAIVAFTVLAAMPVHAEDNYSQRNPGNTLNNTPSNAPVNSATPLPSTPPTQSSIYPLNFSRLDTNRNGTLDQMELNASGAMGGDIFKRIDKNRDGVVTAIELENWNREYAKGAQFGDQRTPNQVTGSTRRNRNTNTDTLGTRDQLSTNTNIYR